MAEPVMTASDPNQYKEQINDILYNKNKYLEGVNTNNQGLKTWAQNKAAPIYSQLPSDLAAQVQGMNASALQTFYNSLTGGTPTGNTDQQQPFTPPATPYDDQVAQTLEMLLQGINTPQTNPYDQAITDLLTQLTNAINTPIADPTSTVQYQAAKERLDRQQGVEVNQAAEVLGGSGLARSSIVTDRAQGIAQEFTDYMETQVLPGIVQQLQADKQNNITNLGQLLGATGDQQGVFDERQRNEIQNIATLYDAMVGQQGRFDELFQNSITNDQNQQQIDLDREQVELTRKRDAFNEEITLLDAAMARTTSFGSVSKADAALLGVPAGTPTFAAADAVARRKHELEIQVNDNNAAMARVNAQNAASWKETQARITADKEAAKLLATEREKTEGKANNIRDLLAVWETSGKAPKGLEEYGVQPGDAPGASPRTPQQILEDVNAERELQKIEDDDAYFARMDELAPDFQRQYGIDRATAEALINAIDNVSKEAAIADINADLKMDDSVLEENGVDVKKLKKLVIQWFNTIQGPPAP